MLRGRPFTVGYAARLFVIIVAVLLGAYFTGQALAAPNSGVPRTLPQGPCDEDHILDIEIIDGVLYECSCSQRIFTENDCEWEEITSQADDPMRFRRIVKRARAKGHRVIARVTPRPYTPPVRLVTPARAATVAAPAPVGGKCSDPYLADDPWSQAHGC